MKLLRFKSNDLIRMDIMMDIKFEIPNSKSILNIPISHIKKLKTNHYHLDDIEILTHIIPSKIVCVGLNYKDHAKELNRDLPLEPKIFIKPSTFIINHNNHIIFPKMTSELKYEVELAFISKNLKILI